VTNQKSSSRHDESVGTQPCIWSHPKPSTSRLKSCVLSVAQAPCRHEYISTLFAVMRTPAVTHRSRIVVPS